MLPQHGTLEISRSRLRHNLAVLQRRVGRAKMCAVIKADAYGHGVGVISPELLSAGMEWLCVYSFGEALALPCSHLPWADEFKILALAPLVLRENGIPSLEMLERLAGGIRITLTDIATAQRLSFALNASRIDKSLHVHVQIDTGLTRMGIEPGKVDQLMQAIESLGNLKLEGVFTHFSHGEVAGHKTVADQMLVLKAVIEPLKKKWPELMVHAQNSGGAWNLGDAQLDLVRVGIALYGLQPSTEHPIPGLQPIARLTAPILAIHDRPAGTGVGYGHTFITKRNSRLAVVPVGYADGYPRAVSNKCVAQIRGIDVPVVGRVSMDQIILDITDLYNAGGSIAPGESVTVISDDPAKPNSLDRMADAMGTIGYELATHLGSRLKRIIVD